MKEARREKKLIEELADILSRNGDEIVKRLKGMEAVKGECKEEKQEKIMESMSKMLKENSIGIMVVQFWMHFNQMQMMYIAVNTIATIKSEIVANM
jgi:polyphosphate kinase 2 (PPK2 family)